MADLFHWWGNDMQLSPSGDLASVEDINKDNQRIFRRLCTNGSQSGAQLGEYLFHPEYGGSAPWYVGQTALGIRFGSLFLEGIIRSQMYHEASVKQSPAPKIKIDISPNGTYSAEISYTNANTGDKLPPLVLDVTG